MTTNNNLKTKKRGRRPNNDADTKEEIINASINVFAKYGLKNSPIRKIASEAGVDSALIYHYFKTKEKLFFEAIKSKLQPPERSEVQKNETELERATRITYSYLTRFNREDNSSAYFALMRSALQNEEASILLRTLFEEQLITHVSKEFNKETAHLRVSLSVSILLGVNFVKNILKFEPLTTMSNEDVSEIIAPLLAPLLSKNFGNQNFILNEDRIDNTQ